MGFTTCKADSLSSPMLAMTFKERENIGLHLCHRAEFQAYYCHLEIYLSVCLLQIAGSVNVCECIGFKII